MIEQWRLARERAFRRHAETVLADDYLTVQEELAFDDFMNALDIEGEALATGWRDIYFKLVVARANDGRLSEIESPHLMRKGEEHAVDADHRSSLGEHVFVFKRRV